MPLKRWRHPAAPPTVWCVDTTLFIGLRRWYGWYDNSGGDVAQPAARIGGRTTTADGSEPVRTPAYQAG